MAYQTEKSLTRARSLRQADTEAERRLWEALRARRLGGFKFVRQLGIGSYIADFACREYKLIVEVDGATHGSPGEIAHDQRRASYLEQQGYSVLRFWNDDIYCGLATVCDAILLALPEQKQGPSQPRALIRPSGTL